MKKYLLLTLLALLNSFVAVAQEPYAVFNNGTLTFYYDNDRAGKEGTAYDLNSGDIVPGWFEIASSITKIVFHPSFADARPVSTTHWFGNGATSSLTTIEGIENLNTSCVTSMKGMFYGCTGLTTLDLSHFDTRNVTNMEGLFAGCFGLTTLDLSYFDTSNVTNMAGMFDGCTQLITLELSRFDTRKVTNMAYMFKGCSQLTTIYCGDNWNTGKVEDSSNMFQYCEKLVGGAGTAFDSDHTDKIYARVDGGPNNPGYLTSADAYAHFQDGTLTFYYDGKKNERQGTVYDLNIGYIAPDWTNDQSVAQSIYKVVFHTSFADARPVSTCRWFSVDVENNKTSSLSTIEGIENLNTSCVTTMAAMFYGCSVLTTLDLSHFDTSNVTDMQSMFYRCNRLTTLNLNHFDTSNVTNMCMMFYGCAWLAMLDLSYFDTRNVTNMAAMFGGCSNLTTINCGDNWNTDHLESSLNMFMECTSLVGGKGTTYDASHLDAAYAHVDGGSDNPGYLTDNWTYAHFLDGTLTFYCDKKKYERQGTVYELNSRNNSPGWSDITPSITKVVFHSSFADARPVSTVGWFYYDETSSLTTIEGIKNLNTSRVKTMAFMFVRCTGLTTLDLSHFDTSKVTDLCGMFYGCSGLTTLDLSHFDTSSVTDMEELFYGCSGLTTLDLSHLNTSKVTHMERMFEGCSGLTKLDLSHFDTSNVTNMAEMFYGCSGLITLDLSYFNTSNVTKMSEMFRDCSNLTTIYCSDKWTTDNVKSSSNMFKDCIKLVGGKGTVYDVNHVNATYAHVDEGTSNPGYLTLKGDTNGDNVIDAQDASLILQYVAKKTDTIQNADVNGDGVVDAQDASLILQQVAKKTKL